jgi:4-amino-4-deoxy-L-arabinose transferase-like glycosyltransferase
VKNLTLLGSLSCLVLLLGFQAWNLVDWNRRETRPPSWDQSVHLEIALDLRDARKAGDLGGFWRMKPKAGMPPFPPLHYAALQFFGEGADPRRALWVNWFYLALLSLSLWGLGRRFAGEWRGLAAAVLFTCIPETQWLLRNQLIDLALAAWVGAAYWALIESERFERRAPSLLFALAAAAAMLTKWSAFSYLLPAAWVALRAWPDPSRRRHALMAAGLASALFLPWYLDQWPVLLPRLVEASSDQAVPVWKGAAFFHYLRQMLGGMDFPFFILGLIALVVPSVRHDEKDKGVLIAWFALSYLFWAVVPNRQLRFLLPGMLPLAVLCSSLWPKALVGGLCAFQLFSAANYSRGWVGPVSIQAGLPAPVPFFSGWEPVAEDWPIDAILQALEEARDKGAPVSDISLVANHASFNGAIFDWAITRRGLSKLHERGVNRRLCEFSEFVIVKTGSLGPAEVVNQLPEVQRLMLDPSSWFQRGWKELRRFPLPDGTEAVVFQQRKLEKAPLKEVKAHFDYFEEGNVVARDMTVDFGRFDQARGVYPLVKLSAQSLSVRGLSIEGLSAEMEDLALIAIDSKDPGKPEAALLNEFRFLKMRRIKLISAAVRRESLAAFLKSRIKGFEPAAVDMDKGMVVASGRLKGVSLSAAASAALSGDGRSLEIAIGAVWVAGVPFPTFLLGRHARYVRGLEPDPELPFELAVSGLSLSGGRLVIGPSDP